tara:strand:- start:23 stop:256 length:234 start_codon:yes stop_codon:yes gene_type:complete
VTLKRLDWPRKKIAVELAIVTAALPWDGTRTHELQVVTEAMHEIDRLRQKLADAGIDPDEGYVYDPDAHYVVRHDHP